MKCGNVSLPKIKNSTPTRKISNVNYKYFNRNRYLKELNVQIQPALQAGCFARIKKDFNIRSPKLYIIRSILLRHQIVSSLSYVYIMFQGELLC